MILEYFSMPMLPSSHPGGHVIHETTADPVQGLFPEGQAAPSMAQASEAEGTHRRLQVPTQKSQKLLYATVRWKKIESRPALSSDVFVTLKG